MRNKSSTFHRSDQRPNIKWDDNCLLDIYAFFSNDVFTANSLNFRFSIITLGSWPTIMSLIIRCRRSFSKNIRWFLENGFETLTVHQYIELRNIIVHFHNKTFSKINRMISIIEVFFHYKTLFTADLLIIEHQYWITLTLRV